MNKFKFLIFILTLFSSQSYGSPIQATDDLVALLKKMDSFEANFSQKINGSTGERISDTKGEVVICRPDRFYWKSVKPDPIVVIADGKHLWTYDIELEQATKQSLNVALKDSPASLLAGSLDDFTKNFTVSYAKPGQCRLSKSECFLLKSKQKDSTFKNIYIGFNDSKLVEVKMSDPLGQHVYTTFSNIKLNQTKIQSSLFKFVPPKNVDVINYD